MVFQLSHHEFGHLSIASVLPTEQLDIGRHGATKNHANIEGATDPFGERGPRDGTHKKADEPVSPSHGTMGDLLGGFGRQHNVVHQDRHVPLYALGP